MSSRVGITQFFAGRNVLITGATGFLGKALIEKLLRSCSNIGTIYVIIRAKTGHTDLHKRLETLLENSIFDTVRNTNPEVLKKICAVSGDIGLPYLGLSKFDQYLLKSNVSVVFHCAASVNFNSELHIAVDQNVQGIRRIVALCRQMNKFLALVHVSTAYSNCISEETCIQEQVYPPPPGTDEILKTPVNTKCSEFSAKIVDFMTTCRPNSYTYTKAIAEYALTQEATDIPVCIVRPSMIIAASHEPVPGWVDSLNGPTALVVGYGTGALKIMHADPNAFINFIPVDFTVNMIISSAWKTAHLGATTPIKVYNCCAPDNQRIQFGPTFNKVAKEIRENFPFSKLYLYPKCSITSNWLWYKLNEFCWHYIPAALAEIVDTESRIRPMRIYEKMKKQNEAFRFFVTNSWKFQTDNVLDLYQSLSREEKLKFTFNMENFDWNEYNKNYALGARRYIMKDPDSTVPKVQKRMKVLKLRTTGLEVTVLTIIVLMGILFAKTGMVLFHGLKYLQQM